jgi:hypothetical protein
MSQPRGTQLLFNRVILRNSKDKENINKALTEWFAIDYHIDSDRKTDCVCTRPNIKHLWKIHNNNTKATLKWVGDCCVKRIGIRKYGRKNLKRIIPKDNTLLTDKFLKQDFNSDTT